MPACCSTCALLRCAVSAAKLASVICDCADDRLVDTACCVVEIAVRRFCAAPRLAWRLFTVCSALSIETNATFAPVTVLMFRVETVPGWLIVLTADTDATAAALAAADIEPRTVALKVRLVTAVPEPAAVPVEKIAVTAVDDSAWLFWSVKV